MPKPMPTKKYSPLTLEYVHKLFLKNKTPPVINYLWTDGADPNKYTKTHKAEYQFIPDGSLYLMKGSKTSKIPDYLKQEKIKYPYHSGNDGDKDPIFYFLGGKHKFDESDGFFESKMQICRDPYLNSLSDTCISGCNWMVAETK
jgi:hypothetical protein